MKKILFGITSLTIGGAERVLVDLANELCNKFDITIFTIYSNGEFEKSLSPKIKLKTLYNKQYKELSEFEKIIIPLKILLAQKKIYNKKIKSNFDVEIAFLEGPITRLFSTRNKKTKKIAWVHNDIKQVFGKNIKSKIKANIDRKIYEKYDKIIFVSEDNKKCFEEIYKENKKEKQVINNYIDKQSVIQKSQKAIDIKFDEKSINFITVARLVEQKAIDRLINIHIKLLSEGNSHKFYVIGDGPQKEMLEKMIKSKNISNTFKLLGKRENPYPYIKNADYFCLLSYFEGYPMVVEEAKILNKKILITDTAAREVVKNYKKAEIFENSEKEIYQGLKNIIENYKKEDDKIEENYNNREIIEKIIKLVGE